MPILPKNFFCTKFEYGHQNNAEFYADFETVKKNAKNLLIKKLQAKKGENWRFSSSILLIAKVFGT